MIHDPAVAALIHAWFEYAGIALGVGLYRSQRMAAGHGKLTQTGNFAVLVGLLIGAMLGNKLVFIAERPDVIPRWLSGEWVFPGQSIVGGLLGGLIGVECAKWLTGQSRSTGDPMIWPLAIGIAVGRIGCFLAGLHDDTYGLPTELSWGVDFGDGMARHPTQLYDILLILGLAGFVHNRYPQTPGLAFKLFLCGYLLWRLLIDSLKPVPYLYPLGLSGIQWVCLLALLIYLPIVMRAWCEHGYRRSATA